MKKKILIWIVFVILVTVSASIVRVETLYIPQVVSRPAMTAVMPLECPTSIPDAWKSWLCSRRFAPAYTLQQPAGQYDYVNGAINTTTQFQLAIHTIWLMQHNTTSPGYYWGLLTVGEELKYNDWIWVQGHGGMIHRARNRTFHVHTNKTYTLVEPEDPYSEWVDDATGYMYDTNEIIAMYDIATNGVVLQTCVGQPITGRRIVVLR